MMADGVALAAVILGAEHSAWVGAQQAHAVVTTHEVVFEADDEAVIHGNGAPAAFGHATPFFSFERGSVREFAFLRAALFEPAAFIDGTPAHRTAADIDKKRLARFKAFAPRDCGVVGVGFESGEAQDRFDFIQQHK